MTYTFSYYQIVLCVLFIVSTFSCGVINYIINCMKSNQTRIPDINKTYNLWSAPDVLTKVRTKLHMTAHKKRIKTTGDPLSTTAIAVVSGGVYITNFDLRTWMVTVSCYGDLQFWPTHLPIKNNKRPSKRLVYDCINQLNNFKSECLTEQEFMTLISSSSIK